MCDSGAGGFEINYTRNAGVFGGVLEPISWCLKFPFLGLDLWTRDYVYVWALHCQKWFYVIVMATVQLCFLKIHQKLGLAPYHHARDDSWRTSKVIGYFIGVREKELIPNPGDILREIIIFNYNWSAFRLIAPFLLNKIIFITSFNSMVSWLTLIKNTMQYGSCRDSCQGVVKALQFLMVASLNAFDWCLQLHTDTDRRGVVLLLCRPLCL